MCACTDVLEPDAFLVKAMLNLHEDVYTWGVLELSVLGVFVLGLSLQFHFFHVSPSLI